jgi:hypothetical protein
MCVLTDCTECEEGFFQTADCTPEADTNCTGKLFHHEVIVKDCAKLFPRTQHRGNHDVEY